MSKPKSCPSTEQSKSDWDFNQIIDCMKEAHNSTPNVKDVNKKFIDNLESAFPGLDLSLAKEALPLGTNGGQL
jgi:hypothetical protein